AGQNAGDGVTVTSGNNTIGGSTTAARNVISGNFGSGVVLNGTAVTGNTVSGNFIGLNAAGTAAVPNVTDGIQLRFGASSNTIGGLTAAEANTIDFASGGGILLRGSGNGNIILGNAIRDGAPGLSIDLENNGHTANDPGDGDSGSNGLQNFPLFLDASMAG